MLRRILLLTMLFASAIAGPAVADEAHEVLLGHPWVVVSVDGAPVDLPGAITFSLSEDLAGDGCVDVAEPGGPQDDCVWLNAKGPLSCGSIDAQLVTQELRLFSPTTTTGVTRCSAGDTIEAVGDALFAARAWLSEDDMLQLLDSNGDVRLALRAEAADYVPPVIEPDLVRAALETSKPVLAGSSIDIATLFAKRPSSLEAGIEVEGCISQITSARLTPESDQWRMEAISFIEGMQSMLYLDLEGDPELREIDDCVVVRLLGDITFDPSDGEYDGYGRAEIVRVVSLGEGR